MMFSKRAMRRHLIGKWRKELGAKPRQPRTTAIEVNPIVVPWFIFAVAAIAIVIWVNGQGYIRP